MTGLAARPGTGGTADVVDGHEFVAENACNRRRLMFVGGRPFGIVGYDADVHLSSFCVGRMSSGGQPFFRRVPWTEVGCRGSGFAEGVRWSKCSPVLGNSLSDGRPERRVVAGITAPRLRGRRPAPLQALHIGSGAAGRDRRFLPRGEQVNVSGYRDIPVLIDLLGDVFQQGLTGPDVPPGERMFFDGLVHLSAVSGLSIEIYTSCRLSYRAVISCSCSVNRNCCRQGIPARPKVYQAVAAAEAGQRDYLGEGFDFVRDVTDFSVVSCVFRCSPFALPFERGDDGGGFGTGRQREFPGGRGGKAGTPRRRCRIV